MTARVDVDGNLWCGWAGGEGLDGVMVFNKGGELIGRQARQSAAISLGNGDDWQEAPGGGLTRLAAARRAMQAAFVGSPRAAEAM